MKRMIAMKVTFAIIIIIAVFTDVRPCYNEL